MNSINGMTELSIKTREALKSTTADRKRTNILMKYEQRLIAFFVQLIPTWISSNTLTAIGFFGNIIVFLSFVLASYLNKNYLLLCVPGFCINWFGDSLDGRLAYYRNKPRKLFGFMLDITIDWIGIILIGLGYIIYARGFWEILGYGFVVMYGWEMILALMKYKLTGKYTIDSGRFGPTEVRIVISAILIAEVILHNSIIYSSLVVIAIMLFVNIIDTQKLLLIADEMDKELNKKLHEENN